MTGNDNTVKRLTEDGRRLVGDSFLKGERPLPDRVIEPYLEDVRTEREVDLNQLDDAVERVISKHDEFDDEMDAALVADVHRTLDIDRRTAGDPGLWHWLALIKYPKFVRHRWEYNSETAMREKFLGAGTDLYSNALHRLWWIAELTSEDDDYTLSKQVFAEQTMVNKVFDRWFARYEDAAFVICDELTDEENRVAEETTTRFNHALTNVQLESLDREGLREMIKEIISDVRTEL